MAHVIDGNAIAEHLRHTIEEELKVLRLSEVRPGLATVLVGEDFAAQAYERHVRRLCEALEYRYVPSDRRSYRCTDRSTARPGKRTRKTRSRPWPPPW